MNILKLLELIRNRSKHGVKVQIIGAENDIEEVLVKNIVFKEVL